MIPANCLIHGEPYEPNEETGTYECAVCQRERQRDKVTAFVVILILTVLFLIGCTTDYRTDQEIAQDVELTSVQIEIRRWYDSQRLKAQQEIADEKAFRDALRRCSNRRIVECL